MVAGLAHHIEHEVAFDQIVPSKAIVPVDASTWAVVAEVVLQRRVGCHGLEEAACLFPVHANLVDVVVGNQVSVWESVCGAKDLVRDPRNNHRL